MPVLTVADFKTLDDGQILIGYLSGLNGQPADDHAGRSHWHGWRHGMIDAGYVQPDDAFLTLRRAFEALEPDGD